MADEVKKPEVVEGDKKPVMMQRVFIKFSNGKVGVFTGMALFSSVEMKLVKLDIADIAFSEPFEMMVRVPKTEEVPNAPTESPKQ